MKAPSSARMMRLLKTSQKTAHRVKKELLKTYREQKRLATLNVGSLSLEKRPACRDKRKNRSRPEFGSLGQDTTIEIARVCPPTSQQPFVFCLITCLVNTMVSKCTVELEIFHTWRYHGSAKLTHVLILALEEDPMVTGRRALHFSFSLYSST